MLKSSKGDIGCYENQKMDSFDLINSSDCYRMQSKRLAISESG